MNSRDTFLVFLGALHVDLQAGAGDWENPSLDRYLGALHAWTEDMGERFSERPSWREFADMLYAAKIYE